jgi:hypothetical protein
VKTPDELRAELAEAYRRAGQPVPLDPVDAEQLRHVTPKQLQGGDDRPPVVHAVRALVFGAAVGLGTLAVLHFWSRRPGRRADEGKD